MAAPPLPRPSPHLRPTSASADANLLRIKLQTVKKLWRASKTSAGRPPRERESGKARCEYWSNLARISRRGGTVRPGRTASVFESRDRGASSRAEGRRAGKFSKLRSLLASFRLCPTSAKATAGRRGFHRRYLLRIKLRRSKKALVERSADRRGLPTDQQRGVLPRRTHRVG